MEGNVNGVDLASVQGFVEAVKENNNLANLRFSAKSKWVGGTKADVSVSSFQAGGQVASKPGRSFKINVTEPPEMGGGDDAPNPVELLASALCGCLTAGIATNAALFGTKIDSLEVDVDVDFDLLGILGMDRGVTCGATGIHYTVRLKGPNKDALLKSKEVFDRKSAIRNTLERAIPITTDVVIG